MRTSITLKVFSIAVLLLVLMAIASAISTYHLRGLAREARELAHYYIPIEQKAHWAARHASAELVHFERALLLAHEGAPRPKIETELQAMDRRGAQVDQVISEAIALVQKGRADRTVNVDPETFVVLERELPQVTKAHALLRDTLHGYLAQSGSRTKSQAVALLGDVIERQRDAVIREIAGVTALLEKLTRSSADQALALERQAAYLTWAVTTGAIALGLFMAGVLTRALLRPVGALLAGTRAVQGGDLSVHINVRTSDELEKLAEAFNQMISGLRQKEAIQTTFGKYVDRRIVERLLSDPQFAQKGERRLMTVFFADLEGYTSLCEQLMPDAAVRLLNQYFTCMAEPILATQGIIDKYIGDSIMAFWGPPFTDEASHARLACEAALTQLKRMAEFRRTVPDLLGLRKGAPRVNMRISIATGDVTIGNVGSDQQKGYTVIGDTVNLASRLNAVGKQYGVDILIADSTWAQTEGALETRELDHLRVVGKSEPVRIFEVLGLKGELSAAAAEARNTFEAALAAYRKGDLSGARELWTQCARLGPADRATTLFLGRLDQLEQDGVPKDWDGVWTLTSK